MAKGKASAKAKPAKAKDAGGPRVHKGGGLPSPAHFKALVAKTIHEQAKGMSEFEISCKEIDGMTYEKRVAYDRAEWLKQTSYGKTVILSPAYYQALRLKYSDSVPIADTLDYDHGNPVNVPPPSLKSSCGPSTSRT